MRERQTLEAQKALDSARDLVALSDLVGTAPTECKPFNDSVRICTWYADRATYGHGTLARSINAGLHKKVTLVCELPDNGEARPENSCTVSIGD